MKKLVIPAALLLIAACSLPFMKERSSEINSATTSAEIQNIPQQNQNETTREFHPQFTALNIPEEMKEHYRVNPNVGQIIVGKSGTMITIPDHAFRFKNGNLAKEKVKMELVEGIKNADIMKMNLGTMSDQGALETGGMISVNVFSEDGDTLQLADGKKLDVEIPTNNLKSGMKLWDGVLQNDGSVSWTNPQPLNENLRAVPVSSLDTTGKKEEEKKPESHHNIVDISIWQRITRSSDGKACLLWWDDKSQTWINENGTTRDSNTVVANSSDGKSLETVNLTDKRFTNTNIATAEFRSRIPFINQCCDTRIMSIYLNNPKRDLWKSDEAVADTLDKEQCLLAGLFHQFANLKQGKVDPKDPKTTEALNSAREKAIKNYSHNVHEQEKLSSFSFGMKKLGWANVDQLCEMNGPKMFFNAHVDGQENSDDVHVTLIVPEKNLFINGYKRPNGDYSFTHGEFEQDAFYPKGEQAYILAKSGEGKNFKFVLKNIILGTNAIESFALHSGTEDEMALALGNQPEPKKDEPEQIIDDWYTKQLKSGGGCLCGGEFGMALAK